MAVLLVTGVAMTSCDKNDNPVVTPVSKTYFPSWNACEALTALQAYVEDVTNPQSPHFISVEDRIATFDMDGTFVGELYPTYFEYNLLEYRVLDDEAYRDRAPEDVREAAQAIRDFVRHGKALPEHFDMIKNLKTNKVLQITQEIGKVPVLSFGNSSGDCAMHNYCLGNKTHRSAAFMLTADDEGRDHANAAKALKLGEQWRAAGYYVISMKHDFKTIYGPGVEKTDFSFAAG